MRGQCGVASSEIDDREVAAPERAANVEAVERPASVRKPTASSAPDIASTKHASVTSSTPPSGGAAAEVVAGERAGPGDAAAVREQAELERGQCRSCRPSACPPSTLLAMRFQSIAIEQSRRQRRSRRAVASATLWPQPRRSRCSAASARLVVAGEALHLAPSPSASIDRPRSRARARRAAARRERHAPNAARPRARTAAGRAPRRSSVPCRARSTVGRPRRSGSASTRLAGRSARLVDSRCRQRRDCRRALAVASAPLGEERAQHLARRPREDARPLTPV